MKTKKINLLFIIALIALMPLAVTETKALSYATDIFRVPHTVNEGEEVSVTITVLNTGTDEIQTATLRYSVDGEVIDIVSPDQTIPVMADTPLTFIFGPFLEGEVIGYRISLSYIIAIDYQSSWMYFTVYESGEATISTQNIILISVCSVITVILIALAVYWIKKRK